MYLARKFMRRHKAVAGGSIVAIAALLMAAVVSTGFAISEYRARRDADRQRAIAEELNGLVDRIVATASPWAELGIDLTVRETLERLAADKRLATLEPGIEGAFRGSLGAAFLDLGHLELAEEQLRRATDLLETSPNRETAIDAEGRLGKALIQQGRLDEAISLLTPLIDRATRQLGRTRTRTIELRAALAIAHQYKGEIETAERLYRRALDDARDLRGPDHAVTLATANDFATLLAEQGRFDEAEAMLVDTIDRSRAAMGDDSPDVLISQGNLASILTDQGRLDEAIRLHETVIAQRRAVMGNDHPLTVVATGNLGAALLDADRPAEAEPLLRGALQFWNDHPSRYAAYRVVAIVNVAQCELELGDTTEARVRATDALIEANNLFPDSDPVGVLEVIRGRALTAEGRYDEADETLRRAHAILRDGPYERDALEALEELHTRAGAHPRPGDG